MCVRLGVSSHSFEAEGYLTWKDVARPQQLS